MSAKPKKTKRRISKETREFFAEMGRLGGKKKTPAKLRSSRRNWKKALEVMKQLNKGRAM